MVDSSAIPWSAWGIKSPPFVTLYALRSHPSLSGYCLSCRTSHSAAASASIVAPNPSTLLAAFSFPLTKKKHLLILSSKPNNPMKRSSLKSLTFVLALSMATILLALPSCKSLDPARLSTLNSQLSTATHSHDTLIIRDSIFVREYIAGDTIFRDRIQYRDRWRTQIIHDTIIRTDSITQVIEHPPERYIPPFYKRCTTILFIILAAGVVWIVGKWYIKIRL